MQFVRSVTIPENNVLKKQKKLNFTYLADILLKTVEKLFKLRAKRTLDARFLSCTTIGLSFGKSVKEQGSYSLEKSFGKSVRVGQ